VQPGQVATNCRFRSVAKNSFASCARLPKQNFYCEGRSLREIFTALLYYVKVLILHQHFKTPATGGAIRSYYLAKALIDHGHTPVVVTADPEGNERTETYEGIEVHYVAVAYNNAFGFYARGWSFLKFLFLAGGEARRINGIDICYAISVPITVSIAARWMRFWRRIPYVLEVGDLWPDAPVQLGFVTNELLKRFLYRIERLAYKKAKAIVALSPDIQRVVRSRAPGKEVHMIPNMADCDYFVPSRKDPLLERDFGVENRFVISYLGAFGFANGLDYIIECARLAASSQIPVHFLLAGEGAWKESLATTAAKLRLNNITFIPHLNRNGVKDVMNVTDAVFVSYRNVEILSTGSPNKFFDGLAAGKLIIINFEGWIKKEIASAGAGIAIESPSHFVDTIVPLIASREYVRAAQAARELAERKYSRALLTREWIVYVERAFEGN
jgi:glycosyltransferase involved in cell wall biosynthesis